MKKMILLFLLISSLSFSMDKVTLTSGEWEPFASKKNKDGRLGEILVEEAFKKVGIKVEFSYFPWKRSFKLAKEAKYDGSILWLRSEEREREPILFSEESIVTSKTVFFHKKDLNFDWKTIDDIKKYRVGGGLGYSVVEKLGNEGVTVEVANSEEANFKKLLAGRIDIYPSSFVVGYTIMKNSFSPDQAQMITNHPVPMEETPLYLIVSKNHPRRHEILDAFNKGMKQLKDSGDYTRIVNKSLGLE